MCSKVPYRVPDFRRGHGLVTQTAGIYAWQLRWVAGVLEDIPKATQLTD